MKALADRITAMARSVRGDLHWPAWSTGETLMVALVLNDDVKLRSMGYTILEALDRVDLTVAELRAIERELE